MVLNIRNTDFNDPPPPNETTEERVARERADAYDPLEAFTLPPADETADERAARERGEQEAYQRSKRIDTELKATKEAMKRHKKAIKVLVLGQSLSGKSTTIKNFQIAYAQKSWSEERLSWKAVILLNLVRSVNIIIDVLNDIRVEPTGGTDSQHELSIRSLDKTVPTEQQRSVILRLAPLRQIEKDLNAFLGAGTSEIEVPSKCLRDHIQASVRLELDKNIPQEFCARSSSGWKSVLDQIKNPLPGKESQLHRVACHVVAGCEDDIRWLWKDSITQKILRNRRLRLEELPGFFLDDIKRISALDYEPSDHDILRARLRTTGVQEYHFSMDRANGTVLDWIMYDVAGIRTCVRRAAWIPYFREITALIFLAPLSGFNERLIEDNRVNRLEDTFLLWETICSSKLLANIQLILFMNKTDLLRKKLEQGILVRKYIPEYEKPNDFENVTTWFRRIFKKIYHDVTPPGFPKTFISHFTSVVDTKATAHTLQAVQATILRNDISESSLM